MFLKAPKRLSNLGTIIRVARVKEGSLKIKEKIKNKKMAEKNSEATHED